MRLNWCMFVRGRQQGERELVEVLLTMALMMVMVMTVCLFLMMTVEKEQSRANYTEVIAQTLMMMMMMNDMLASDDGGDGIGLVYCVLWKSSASFVVV